MKPLIEVLMEKIVDITWWFIVRSCHTVSSVVPCIHLLFQPIFGVIAWNLTIMVP